MFDTITLGLVALSTLIVGVLIGSALGGRFSKDGRNGKQAREAYERIKREQEQYQEKITQHFEETAQLLNTMANSYRNVHNHLVEGAQKFSSHSETGIHKLPEETSTTGKPKSSPVHLEQPLDYAPRDPEAPGALHEEFGLEKKAAEKPTTPKVD